MQLQSNKLRNGALLVATTEVGQLRSNLDDLVVLLLVVECVSLNQMTGGTTIFVKWEPFTKVSTRLVPLEKFIFVHW
jgi:hypothetical protein